MAPEGPNPASRRLTCRLAWPAGTKLKHQLVVDVHSPMRPHLRRSHRNNQASPRSETKGRINRNLQDCYVVTYEGISRFFDKNHP
jgi:hypothetical protein